MEYSGKDVVKKSAYQSDIPSFGIHPEKILSKKQDISQILPHSPYTREKLLSKHQNITPTRPRLLYVMKKCCTKSGLQPNTICGPHTAYALPMHELCTAYARPMHPYLERQIPLKLLTYGHPPDVVFRLFTEKCHFKDIEKNWNENYWSYVLLLKKPMLLRSHVRKFNILDHKKWCHASDYCMVTFSTI